MSNDKLQLFEDQPIRTAWDEENEEWYFSIVDVIRVLTDQPDTRHAAKYWSVMKTRLKKEGNQLTTVCSQLKLLAADGKRYNTDVAETSGLLRIIESIPSPKAEPFKMWLAQVGKERMEETIDPELTINRALETYSRLGYSPEWINQRMRTIQARKELTDEWKAHGVETELTKVENPQGLQENIKIAKSGGEVAGDARKAIESRTGRPVITSQNAKQLNAVVTDLIEGVVKEEDDE